MTHTLFSLGKTCLTRGALLLSQSLHFQPITLFRRHALGDWGDLSREDNQANLNALADNSRILSVYVVAGHTFYIITEADRSVTTMLLPSEY